MKLSLLMLTLMTLPHLAQAAQVVEKDLGGSGNWKAAKVADHALWKKNACLAYTKATDGAAVLELYAEQSGDTKGVFVEPTLQVVVPVKDKDYLRGSLTSDTGKVFQLTLASTRETPPALGLLARIDDRKKMIEVLKDASSVKVQLINAKVKAVKTYTFSLKGSTKGIEAAMKGCDLATPN